MLQYLDKSRQISTNLDHDSKFENLSSRAAPARTNSDLSDLKYLKTSQKAYHNIMVRNLVLLQRHYRYFSVRYGTYMEPRRVLVHYVELLALRRVLFILTRWERAKFLFRSSIIISCTCRKPRDKKYSKIIIKENSILHSSRQRTKIHILYFDW
jgi:hypothetical protein